MPEHAFVKRALLPLVILVLVLFQIFREPNISGWSPSSTVTWIQAWDSIETTAAKEANSAIIDNIDAKMDHSKNFSMSSLDPIAENNKTLPHTEEPDVVLIPNSNNVTKTTPSHPNAEKNASAWNEDTAEDAANDGAANDPKEEAVLTNQSEPSPNLYYSVARYDRSGSVIQDMLRAHAFAFANNQTYGGACLCCRRKQEAKKRRPMVQALLTQLGLDTMLPYACPKSLKNVSSDHRNKKTITARELFGSEWKQHVLSQWDKPPPPTLLQINTTDENSTSSSVNSNATIVAVHIRRGDVNPCKYPDRYRPNSHYLRLIAAYTQGLPDVKVYIFSESQSFEPFDEFVRRNYTVRLDTDLPEVLRTIMSADIVITSVSSFSYFPAVLNYKPNAKIIHTGGSLTPLAHWIIVNSTFNSQTDLDMKEVRRPCWAKKTNNNDTSS